MCERFKKNCAIVLAAGQGRRMNSSVQKQYMLLSEKPVLWYSLHTFQEAKEIDEIILVVGTGEEAYCQETFVEHYGFDKVKMIVPGGKERYESVAFGLLAAEGAGKNYKYIYVHDGARPFVNKEILERAQVAVERYEAVVVGMPIKDTIKIADAEGKVDYSPERSKVWVVQTPQVFAYSLILAAYKELLEKPVSSITDDAMVVETYTKHPVYFVEGSYENIKITTPEDIRVAEAILNK